MRRWLGISRRFAFRLVAGLLALVLITTLGAGVPAYWLTRSQLQSQARTQVADAHRATLALLQANQTRLTTLASLLAERPTLRRLLSAGAATELESYLAAFKAQSGLELITLCDATGQPVFGDRAIANCPAPDATILARVDGVPVWLAAHAIGGDEPGSPLGTAVAGIWLDDAFLRRLAADTGLEQSLLLPDGARSASSIAFAEASQAPPTAPALEETRILIGDATYLVERSPLRDSTDAVAAWIETALPVEPLVRTEQRAAAVLIMSTGLIALIGISAGAWYVRRLTKPLHKLTVAAERISAGEFLTPIPDVSGPVEITTLSAALRQGQKATTESLAELAQARDWLTNLIQSIVEGVITYDDQGRVTFLSRGAEPLTGWASEDALGKPIDDVIQSADATRGRFRDQLPEPGHRVLIDICTRDDRQVTLAVTLARMTPPNAAGMQTALVLRDVTAEEALRHLRSYFLANISHELQTPLSTLNASIELLLDGVDELTTAEIRELMRPAHLSLLSLRNLVNNLLESSRIEAGHFAVTMRPVNLNQVISDALKLVQPLFERRSQKFTLSEPAAFIEYPEIMADGARLTLALVNLLTNASKYSPIGERIELWIELNAHTQNDGTPGEPTHREQIVRLSVADRGPGIPPRERTTIYQRFVRLESRDDEQYGVGLGLHVVKTTIEAHGGSVGLDVRSGGGSIFWFELPVMEGKADDDIDSRRRSRAAGYPIFHPTPRRLRRRDSE